MKKSRLLLLATIPACLLGGLAAWLVTSAVSARAAEIYVVNAPFDEDRVDLNRDKFDGDPKSPNFHLQVLRLYGIPEDVPARLLFVDAKRLSDAKELKGLKFLKVDNQKGDLPLQAKTIDFIGEKLGLGSLVAAAFFVVANLLVFAASPAKGGRSAAAD